MRLYSHPFEILYVGGNRIIINKGFVYDMATLNRFDISVLDKNCWREDPQSFEVSDGDNIYIKVLKEKRPTSNLDDYIVGRETQRIDNGIENSIRETTHYFKLGELYSADLQITQDRKDSSDDKFYILIGTINSLENEDIDQHILSDIFLLNELYWTSRDITEIDDSDSDSDSDSGSDNSSDSDSSDDIT